MRKNLSKTTQNNAITSKIKTYKYLKERIVTSEKTSGDAKHHTPQQLTKYLTKDAGIDALESQSLLWSSPNAFTSPFEMNGRYLLPFSGSELLNAAVKVSCSLIFSELKATGDTPIVAAINRWKDEDRFETPEEAKSVLSDLLAKMIAHKEEELHKTLLKWQQFVESIRVCCLCKSADNPSAWAQFAENHQGIAITLNTTEENGLVHAHPVHYSQDRIHITSIKEQMGNLIYGHTSHPHQRFAKNLLYKPTFCTQESEWRVINPSNDNFIKTQHPDKDKKPLTPGSIASVYLGVNATTQTCNTVIKAAKNLQPAPKIYTCAINKKTFAIDHIPI